MVFGAADPYLNQRVTKRLHESCFPPLSSSCSPVRVTTCRWTGRSSLPGWSSLVGWNLMVLRKVMRESRIPGFDS